jgi:hypothetical protein
MFRRRRWISPSSLCLCAAAAGVSAGAAQAQQRIPEKYQAQAAALNGGSLAIDPADAAALTSVPGSDERRRAERRAADSIAATTPQITHLMDGLFEIPRGAYRDKGFEVPADSHCTVTGDSDGGAREIEVLVLPSTDMSAWRGDAQAGKPAWRSGLTKSATLSVSLPDAGTYSLVVSNRDAWFLSRTVKTKIQLECTRDWPPE